MTSKTNKTAPTIVSVDDFLATLSEQRQTEARQCIEIMQEITGQPPVMWGPSIIGFGSYHYKYESGREGDAPATGFSPRKANLVFYLADAVSRYETLLDNLGPYTTGQACLYIKRLSAIDLDVLYEIIAESYQYVSAQESMDPTE